MLIFYSESAGRPNVSLTNPVETPVILVLEIYRSLDPRRGFLGTNLREDLCLQFIYRRGGKAQIELLDRKTASFDMAVVESDFGERLICAVDAGEDVFALARREISGWEHVGLRRSKAVSADGGSNLGKADPEAESGKNVVSGNAASGVWCNARPRKECRIDFTATEAGFPDGLGGASNARGGGDYHYFLFGVQEDRQHPSNSGVYFEYDSRGNGGVNQVIGVSIEENAVEFSLKAGEVILVRSGVRSEERDEFLRGVRAVFKRVYYRLRIPFVEEDIQWMFINEWSGATLVERFG
jgi:hypothetical protein